MAGLSNVADGSALDCFKTLKNLLSNYFCLDLKTGSKGCVKGGDNKVKHLFNQFVSFFLNEIRGSKPLPPMLGNGQSMDLFKLYLVVRENGGYEAVSGQGLWGFVAKECGLDPSMGSSLKLIYVKYLDLLDKWLQRPVNDKDSGTIESVSLMDLESESKGFFPEISDQKKDGEHMELNSVERKLNLTSDKKLCKGDKVRIFVDLEEEGNENSSDKQSESSVVGECGFSRKKGKDNGLRSSGLVSGNKKSDNDKESADDDKCDVDISNVVKESGCNQKRKRECCLAVLDWVKKVAKDPCDPSVESLPERSEWKSFGDDHLWRQVLLAREAVLLKRNASRTEQSIWQQKMHPTMYEDHSTFETPRSSRRILSAKESTAALSFKKSKAPGCSESSSSATNKDLESNPQPADPLTGLWINNYSRKRAPLGPNFQAKVPEWTGETYESDSKWLGTRIWPEEKRKNCHILIERDRIGFGRQESCGCEFLGSFQCVRFHIAEKRIKVKLELGTAFYNWQIDKMGEETALSWSQAEEKKFEDIIKSNPLAQGKSFWKELSTLFSNKKREQLVSYYFNVFVLRQRGQQNRLTPSEINSDDDEPEVGSTTNCTPLKPPGSIYCSPKKRI